MPFLYRIIPVLFFFSCQGRSRAVSSPVNAPATVQPAAYLPFDSSIRTIHVLVALCDNRYQGIVPVPAKIGNGQDPANNLYWGCAFGVRTFFAASADWVLLRTKRLDSIRLQRLVFRHRRSGSYLIADAYDGQYIKACTNDFLKSCAGQLKDTLQAEGKTIGIHGNARLVAYTGHDGLMDFTLPPTFGNTDGKKRDAIILACISRKYFGPLLASTRARPLVWSTGLMSPEAYTLHAAVDAYLSNATPAEIRNRAAKAYARYQHCSEKAAMRLLTGE